MPIAIRRFEYARDIDALIAFMPDLYETNFPDFVATPGFLSRRRQNLREAVRDPAQLVLVADAGRGAVGFIWLLLELDGNGRRRGEVAALYVHSKWRGRGVGKALMAEAEECFRSWGCHSVHLMVTASNGEAVGLYRAMGYGVTRYQMEKPLR